MKYKEGNGVIMSECSARRIVCRIVGVLLLAATAAACDQCGHFVPPIRLQADLQPDACRDAPRPN
jgi:hypothetical protein